MSRIIAGVAGGQPLTSVPGTATRPTTDRVKESVFSRLEHWDVLTDARVLDLFAGSGALGLEALSRGARRAVLVDVAEPALKAARANAEKVNRAIGGSRRVGQPAQPQAAGQPQRAGDAGTRGARVVKGKAPGILASLKDTWDVVFLDPPYPMSEPELAEILALVTPTLAEDAVVVVERSSRSPEPEWPTGLRRIRETTFGETCVWFAEPAGREDDADGAENGVDHQV